MKHPSHPRPAAAILALALALATDSIAAAPRPPAQIPPATHPDSASWPALFQPDLSDAIFPAGIWSIQEGALTATEDQAIWTNRELQRFILDLEFKTAHGSNSGVIVYCSDAKQWIPNSIEIQIADDHAEKRAKSPATWQCGAIFGRLAPTRSVVKRPGEWNRLTITCDGPMIDVLLNDTPVNSFDLRKWTDPKKNPDGSEIPPWLSKPAAQLPTRGRIGLQGKHGGAPIFFRNIKILELP